MKWRNVTVAEALDHAIGRTIASADWDSSCEQVTKFTDGTAVRLTIDTFYGSEFTGSWTERDFEIGEPD